MRTRSVLYQVVFIAATAIFAQSVERDLKDAMSANMRIVVRQSFRQLVKSQLTSRKAGLGGGGGSQDMLEGYVVDTGVVVDVGDVYF